MTNNKEKKRNISFFLAHKAGRVLFKVDDKSVLLKDWQAIVISLSLLKHGIFALFGRIGKFLFFMD